MALRARLLLTASFILWNSCGERDSPQECFEPECSSPGGIAHQSWNLEHGGLKVVLLRRGAALAWGDVVWSGGGDCADSLPLGPLFAARIEGESGGRTISSEACTLVGEPAPHDHPVGLRAIFSCPSDLHVEWSATVEGLAGELGAVLRTKLSVAGRHRLQALATLFVLEAPCVRAEATGAVDGSPVRAGNGRFLLALEHPLAKHQLRESATGWIPQALEVVAQVSHLAAIRHDAATRYEYGSVVVATSEPKHQCRRAFAEYLNAARPKDAWKGPLVHYNSWYDFHSWQDEGFFRQEPDLLRSLRKEPMGEVGAVQRIGAFKNLTDRGVKMDSFLIDDGWDTPTALWEFDRDKFPNGFKPLALKAQELGAGLSVWLSPWGGYGKAKEERVRLGTQQGYETNAQGLSLAGPKYAARFKEAVVKFRREARVNMFKFDGVAGDPSQLPAEVEAILNIASDLRREIPADDEVDSPEEEEKEEVGSAVVDTGEKQKKKRRGKSKHFWINLTTGTWPSPFFMLWVDSIWRGHTDTLVPDWEVLSGVSRRQRWQVWRECVVQQLIVDRAELFPISRLMVHGVVLAGHGDALYNGLSDLEPVAWAQEVWSFAAMGLQLQELYVSSKTMVAWAWDELAAALRWAREHYEVLQDAHWTLAADCPPVAGQTRAPARANREFMPYAIAAYKRQAAPDSAGRGFLFLRNPRNVEQKTPRFRLAEALELPKEQAESGRQLIAQVVRRISTVAEAKEVLDCESLGKVAKPLSRGKCLIPADAKLQISMEAGEVLVLQFDVQPLVSRVV